MQRLFIVLSGFKSKAKDKNCYDSQVEYLNNHDLLLIQGVFLCEVLSVFVSKSLLGILCESNQENNNGWDCSRFSNYKLF